MRHSLLLILVLAGFFPARAAEESFSADDLIPMGRQWLQENIDPDALRALGADPKELDRLLAQLQKQFQGEYVLDLAALKSLAPAILPLLEASEETKPYAAWLRTRLDYVEVAETLRQQAPPPKPKPGEPPPKPANPSAEAERKVWQKQLQTRPWPAAAQEYVPKLKPLFTAQKVPAELVWVAEVESSFNPQARSPVGASGLFQLMPETAKSLGLSLWPRDQRRDPERSATAAAKQLRALHGQFHDWRLAVAAYNAGAGRVNTLLKASKTKTFDAIAQRLPAETQMYVPKVEATLLKREGALLSRLKAPTA